MEMAMKVMTKMKMKMRMKIAILAFAFKLGYLVQNMSIQYIINLHDISTRISLSQPHSAM